MNTLFSRNLCFVLVAYNRFELALTRLLFREIHREISFFPIHQAMIPFYLLFTHAHLDHPLPANAESKAEQIEKIPVCIVSEICSVESNCSLMSDIVIGIGIRIRDCRLTGLLNH